MGFTLVLHPREQNHPSAKVHFLSLAKKAEEPLFANGGQSGVRGVRAAHALSADHQPPTQQSPQPRLLAASPHCWQRGPAQLMNQTSICSPRAPRAPCWKGGAQGELVSGFCVPPFAEQRTPAQPASDPAPPAPEPATRQSQLEFSPLTQNLGDLSGKSGRQSHRSCTKASSSSGLPSSPRPGAEQQLRAEDPARHCGESSPRDHRSDDKRMAMCNNATIPANTPSLSCLILSVGQLRLMNCSERYLPWMNRFQVMEKHTVPPNFFGYRGLPLRKQALFPGCTCLASLPALRSCRAFDSQRNTSCDMPSVFPLTAGSPEPSLLLPAHILRCQRCQLYLCHSGAISVSRLRT